MESFYHLFINTNPESRESVDGIVEISEYLRLLFYLDMSLASYNPILAAKHTYVTFIFRKK